MARTAKTCSRCQVLLPIEEFGTFVRASRGGRTYRFSHCRKCKKAAHDPLAARKSVLRTRYGLTWEAFEEMLAAQGGGCGVCGSLTPGGKGHWHIDHDHSCCHTDSSRGIVKTCGNCVRGVLCHLCNTALGCARDDVQVLKQMIEYLSHYEEAHGA